MLPDAAFAHGTDLEDADNGVPRFHLALELKHTRDTMTDHSLGDELLADRDRYGASGQVNHLICWCSTKRAG